MQYHAPIDLLPLSTLLDQPAAQILSRKFPQSYDVHSPSVKLALIELLTEISRQDPGTTVCTINPSIAIRCSESHDQPGQTALVKAYTSYALSNHLPILEGGRWTSSEYCAQLEVALQHKPTPNLTALVRDAALASWIVPDLLTRCYEWLLQANALSSIMLEQAWMLYEEAHSLTLKDALLPVLAQRYTSISSPEAEFAKLIDQLLQSGRDDQSETTRLATARTLLSLAKVFERLDDKQACLYLQICLSSLQDDDEAVRTETSRAVSSALRLAEASLEFALDQVWKRLNKQSNLDYLAMILLSNLCGCTGQSASLN